MGTFRDFYSLFQGQPNAYGADTAHGVRCVHDQAIIGATDHWKGVQSIGIYPMWNDEVHWGCTDIDNGSWEDAKNMRLILDRMGLNPWVELSRSKGYHVWVFADDWVPAWIMRRAFLFAHYVSDQLGTPVPPTEVNPKAEWLEGDKLGNFVRLPYVGQKADENGRRVMLDDNAMPIGIDTFLNAVEPVTEAQLRVWADKYQPPRRRMSEFQESSEEAKTIAQRLNGKGFVIFRDGPPEWDPRRSQAMIRLAQECARSGLSEGEALVLVTDLSERLDKWTSRTHTVEQSDKARRSCVQWGYDHA